MKFSSFVSKTRRRGLYERDAFRCWYCGRAVIVCSARTALKPDGTALNEAQLDHLIPQSRGGKHDDENLVTSCKSCNASKNGKTVEEYRDYLRYSFHLPPAAAVLSLRAALAACPTPYDGELRAVIEFLDAQIAEVHFYGEMQSGRLRERDREGAFANA